MRRSLTISLAAIVVLLAAWSPADRDAGADGKVGVIAGVLPISYFVERVGGPYVDVGVLVGPGQDPHSFELTPRLVAKMAEARLLFKVGFPFEDSLIQKAGSTFKNLRVIDIQQGIKLRPMTEEKLEAGEAGHGHAHGGAPEHAHGHEAGDSDPHTWLDPRLAKIQARTIADALIGVDPAHKAQYEKNAQDFQADLDAVHERLTRVLAPVKGKSFFVFHPAYGYFGDAYGLKQVPVQMAGKEPTAKQLARLIDLAEKEKVKVIFVQPQFSKKSAAALAEAIGATVAPLDDLAPDYLKNLQQMADKLDSALSAQRK